MHSCLSVFATVMWADLFPPAARLLRHAPTLLPQCRSTRQPAQSYCASSNRLIIAAIRKDYSLGLSRHALVTLVHTLASRDLALTPAYQRRPRLAPPLRAPPTVGYSTIFDNETGTLVSLCAPRHPLRGLRRAHSFYCTGNVRMAVQLRLKTPGTTATVHAMALPIVSTPARFYFFTERRLIATRFARPPIATVARRSSGRSFTSSQCSPAICDFTRRLEPGVRYCSDLRQKVLQRRPRLVPAPAPEASRTASNRTRRQSSLQPASNKGSFLPLRIGPKRPLT
jgi:hypothetical protein